MGGLQVRGLQHGIYKKCISYIIKLCDLKSQLAHVPITKQDKSARFDLIEDNQLQKRYTVGPIRLKMLKEVPILISGTHIFSAIGRCLNV